VILVFVAGFASACHNQDRNSSSATGPAAATQTTTYTSRGIVKSIDAKRPSIEIDHEDIPGLMPAMTMEFYVRDATLLNGIKSGDGIDFTIENGVGGLIVTRISKAP